MLDHGVDATVVRWIDKMLSDRILTTEFGGITAGGLANRGCPQGGILSPMLWCLAVDSLLEKLRLNGFQVWGYADDIAVVAVHEDGRAAKRLINSALRLMEDWCSETNLSVNPTKTELLVVTRKKKRLNVQGIKLNGVQLTKSDQVKYLGVTFSSNLSWRVQVERTVNRARKNLATISRMVGSTWGLTPAAAHWVYSCIILPRLFFGAVIWWEGVQNLKIGNKLESLQHVGLKRILGAFRYSPTRAMEAMLAMPPLLFRIEEVAIRTAKLLRDWGKWQSTDRGHSSVLLKCIPETERNLLMTLDSATDKISLTFRFGRRFRTMIPGRDEWKNGRLERFTGWNEWFTDGSKDEESVTGCAWVSGLSGENGSEYLGKFATVYQAEVVAVLRCAEGLINRGIRGENIIIFTDSESTVKTMERSSFKSAIALECCDTLNKLALVNRKVILSWCPGHRGVAGNEEADRLAKLVVKEGRPGVEPWLPVSYAGFKSELKRFSLSRLINRWSGTTNCRQGKEMIGEINVGKAKMILRMNRADVRILTYVLTGHAPLRYHLFRMGVRDSGHCSCNSGKSGIEWKDCKEKGLVIEVEEKVL
ncbi:uncharacterized protein LOC108631211 [Ceratina calcarata]|uniref:Uncharacterized protein LOC108631211 n=1 Tax=Ceratina calcarata TaxID=156304 RepID=A0AAJ7JE36_9HYME|nr:uncharacterized protein LOC108631211 [Ceratina calcarata]